MRKISFLILLGILAFSLESCSKMSKSDEKSVDNKSVKTVVAVGEQDIKQTNKNQKSAKKAAEEFEEAKREENVAGLIPATKPEIRVKSSIRGRQDPFAVVTVKPQIEIEKGTIKPKPTTKTIKNPGIPVIDEGPKIPKAELAENVLITGLIELGDHIKLIVQAPEETSARYVEIGQYLSNGKVLVKRIEPSSPFPTVILEQNGEEVAKVIGENEEEGTL